MSQRFDVAIVGGAMAGATLALALAAQRRPDGGRWRVALIESQPPGEGEHPGFDSRAIALAEGSVRRLAQLGIWPALAPHAAPIDTIQVSDQGHFGGLTLDASEYDVDALGQVVELERVGPVLWQRLSQAQAQNPDQVHCFCPDRLATLTQLNDHLSLTLDSGAVQEAALVVGADGTHSGVRAALGLTMSRQAYDQTALIANIRAEQHDATAFERFTREGPLALLPMCEGRHSLVWVQSPEQAQRRLALDEADFAAELQQAFGYRLGRIERVGQRGHYPLALCWADAIRHHRCVLVGNAAQTLHPIAGQGFNLGLRDVETLAGLLEQALLAGSDPGTFSLLREYEQRRQADRNRTMTGTDGLVRLFSNASRMMALGRNSGLLAMNLLPGLKHGLAHQAMGWRD